MIIGRFFREWILPPKVSEFVMNFYYDFMNRLTIEEKNILSNNVIFKDKYKGKRCFVIGNGSSLRDVDLSRLDGEITIVMNYFNNNPVLEKWQPTAYCAADPPSSYNADELSLMKEVSYKISPKVGYFFPISVREIFEKNNLFPRERTYYLDMREPIDRWENSMDDLDFTRSIPSVQSTAQLGILLSIYLGCDEIYLLGLDHNWLAYHDCLSAPHFYEETSTNCDHQKPKSLKYLDFIKSALVLFKGYENIHNYTQQRDIKIINLTEGGYLDEFPQKKYRDVVPIFPQ